MRTKREKLLAIVKTAYAEREGGPGQRKPITDHERGYDQGHLNGILFAAWVGGFISEDEYDYLLKNGELPAKPKQPDRRTAAFKHSAQANRNINRNEE